jgi:hypothetical protein
MASVDDAAAMSARSAYAICRGYLIVKCPIIRKLPKLGFCFTTGASMASAVGVVGMSEISFVISPA